ncbi:MAG: hypothetical protein AVDCRST_MAG88-3183, partial [uncultured Thermomicrobiales bacterium]
CRRSSGRSTSPPGSSSSATRRATRSRFLPLPRPTRAIASRRRSPRRTTRSGRRRRRCGRRAPSPGTSPRG